MRFLLYFHVYTYLSRQLFVIHLLLAIACVVSAGIMADKAKDLDDYGFYKLFFTRWNELIAALVSETPWLEEGRGVTLLVTLCTYQWYPDCRRLFFDRERESLEHALLQVIIIT